jgi:hypothetical protein
MVKSLDPDAPHRTGKQLHDLDQERGNAHKLFFLLGVGYHVRKFFCGTPFCIFS